ncbi:hypothetical protein JAAARDRAFT_192478 [Jaapia argillacea MUCL 33604]|uniref:Uncharacterized protein n=1 Tax=Jaapia argillacea MUCL 33604 TaxID=933084 RepID=A0A067PVY8_9AGAM|nr:hypothetical protein JAAARDRAFT_192478 [Jaapia argillacea MUCL 33604]
MAMPPITNSTENISKFECWQNWVVQGVKRIGLSSDLFCSCGTSRTDKHSFSVALAFAPVIYQDHVSAATLTPGEYRHFALSASSNSQVPSIVDHVHSIDITSNLTSLNSRPNTVLETLILWQLKLCQERESPVAVDGSPPWIPT